MKILSVEASASPASVAITENGKVLSSSYININLTHSQTLMNMVDGALKNVRLTIDGIDAFAVSAGPGSFTGLRIALSLIKGLAEPFNKPCVGVSTLEAMAYNHKSFDGIVCCLMDARCNQVYNAIFSVKSGEIKRLVPDRAVLCEEVISDLKGFAKTEKVLLCGDGADLLFSRLDDKENITAACEPLKYQNAAGVGFLAEKDFEDKAVSPDKLTPVYLRLPQAERELKAKKEKASDIK